MLVRIVDGLGPGEGRVEVYHDGVWGTVCHDHWSVDDANVVCKELGYAHAIAYPDYSAFGTGHGQVGNPPKVHIRLCVYMYNYMYNN